MELTKEQLEAKEKEMQVKAQAEQEKALIEKALKEKEEQEATTKQLNEKLKEYEAKIKQFEAQEIDKRLDSLGVVDKDIIKKLYSDCLNDEVKLMELKKVKPYLFKQDVSKAPQIKFADTSKNETPKKVVKFYRDNNGKVIY